MERATPVQMRQGLEIVERLKRAGIRFVPIPVFNNEDYKEMMEKLICRIDMIEKAVQ